MHTHRTRTLLNCCRITIWWSSTQNSDRHLLLLPHPTTQFLSQWTLSTGTKMEDAEEERNGLSNPSPWRIGWTKLDSCPSKPNNIEISPSGTVLVRNDEKVHIINLAYGIAPFLQPDSHFVHHKNAAKQTKLFQTCLLIHQIINPGKQGRKDLQGNADKLSYELRFLQAKWSPLELGPNASPIFVTLTSRRALHVWFAPENQLKGPWECYCCLSEPNSDGTNEYARDVPFSSFTWLKLSSEKSNRNKCCYLMATSMDESRIVIWKFQKDEDNVDKIRIAVVYDEIIESEVDLSKIYLLCPTSFKDKEHHTKHLISAFTIKGVFQLNFNERNSSLQIGSIWEDGDGKESQGLFNSKHVSHAEWHDRDLFVCTAGELFKFRHTLPSASCYPRYGKLVFVEVGEESQLVNLQPVVGLQHDDHSTGVTIFLKDGSIYRKEGKFEKTKQRVAIKPIAELEAPNEELADLQREVERLRGMYGYKSDGVGLTYLCFDSNELNAWAFFPHLRTFLEVALLEGPDEENDVKRAEEILYDFIENEGLNGEFDFQVESVRTKLRQHLLMFYTQSSRKSEILSVLKRIVEECLGGIRLRSGFQLACWLVGEYESKKPLAHKEAIELRSNFQIRLALMNIENQIQMAISLMQNGTINIRSDPLSEVHCMILASIAFCLIQRVEGDLELIKTFLIKIKGGEMQVKLIRDWTKQLENGQNDGLDVGERCPICDCPVLVLFKDSTSPTTKKTTKLFPFEARCREGHEWKRCSISFGLIKSIQSLVCTICSHRSTLVHDSQNELQRNLIQTSLRCSLCKGAQVVI